MGRVRIEIEPFDLGNKEHCIHVTASLVAVFKDYHDKHSSIPFKFDFYEFMRDWWQGGKVLLVGYDDDAIVAVLYASVETDIFTSQKVLHVQCKHTISPTIKGEDLELHAEQLLPVYGCTRIVN